MLEQLFHSSKNYIFRIRNERVMPHSQGFQQYLNIHVKISQRKSMFSSDDLYRTLYLISIFFEFYNEAWQTDESQSVVTGFWIGIPC